MFLRIGGMFNKVRSKTKPKSTQLEHTSAAVLAMGGFEEYGLMAMRSALMNHGCEVKLVSPTRDKIRGWRSGRWGKNIAVDLSTEEAADIDFDFLVIPGGVMSIDQLRASPLIASFVKRFVQKKRPIAAMGHGPQILIDTGLLEGRTMTSTPTIKNDLLNAGADWVNREVMIDQRLITSRSLSDLHVFIREMIRVFDQGKIRRAIPDMESFIFVR